MTDNVSLNDCRRDFEVWALPYLKRQYSFYNEYTIRDMLWKSEGANLYAAWKACWELQDARVKGAMA